MSTSPTRPAVAEHWLLEPEVCFLNHGSFGACPRAVLDVQRRWRERLEREPVRFMVRELQRELDHARETLARFVGASPEGLVFVPNATTGVNAVLRSLELEPGDELLTHDHAYGACRNTLEALASRRGARVVVASIPFPLASPEQVVGALVSALTERTRLALVDHVTSPTGLVLPVERLVPELEARGVPVLVDGAHAPGMLPLEIEELGASWYTGNCHKWICAPKGAGLLWAREDRRQHLHPVTISHGYAFPSAERSRYQLEFDWPGTYDPSAILSVPAALEFMGGLLPGGWPELMSHNHELVLEARGLLAATLGVDAPCPAAMIGSLAALHLPDGSGEPPNSPLYTDPLQDALLERDIEVPVVPWPEPPRRLLRISAQVYNQRSDYEQLARALPELLAAGR